MIGTTAIFYSFEVCHKKLMMLETHKNNFSLHEEGFEINFMSGAKSIIFEVTKQPNVSGFNPNGS